MRKLYATFILASTVFCAQAQTYTATGSTTVITPNVHYQLTPVAPQLEKSGGVWANTQVNLANDFIVHAELNFGSFSATNEDINSPVGFRTGADGIAFVLAPAPYVGQFGEEIGYGTTTIGGVYTNTNSFAIEMDTWQNITFPQGYRNHNDPAADHLAFMSRGNTIHGTPDQIGATVSVGELEDGLWHDVVIQWDAATSRLSLTLDGAATPTITAIIPNLATLAGSNMLSWGFTAGTGSATNAHQVRFPQQQSCGTIIPCGRGEKKVMMCHKPFGNGNGINGTNGGPNVLCIPWQAVPAHLAHGDCLGDCTNLPERTVPTNGIANEVAHVHDATIFPNPSRGQVSVNLGHSSNAEVMIVNTRGVTVERRAAGGAQTLNFNLKKYGTGVYMVKIVNGGQVQTSKVLVQD